MDTRDKRASAIGVDAIYARVYPNPDGSNTEGDRQQTGLSYRFADEAAGGYPPGHSYSHSIGNMTTIGSSRTWSN